MWSLARIYCNGQGLQPIGQTAEIPDKDGGSYSNQDALRFCSNNVRAR